MRLFTPIIALLGCWLPVIAAAEQAPAPLAAAAGDATQLTCPPTHPLRPAWNLALDRREHAAWIRDYTARLTIRVLRGHQLGAHEYYVVAARTRPASLYLRRLGPAPAGMELITCDGRFEQMAQVHDPGWGPLSTVTLALAPDSPRLRTGAASSLAEVGSHALVTRFIALIARESRFAECEVRIDRGTKVDGRPTTCVQVLHPVPRAAFTHHLLRLYFDDETSLAVRWEAYDWPREPGARPQLVAEQTLSQLEINVGLGDDDFDPDNPAYAFP